MDMMDPYLALLTIFVGFVFTYLYSRKHLNYWKQLGIPQAPAFPLLGTIPYMIYKPFHHSETWIYEAKGRIYGYYECYRPVLTVAEPDLIRCVLIKDSHCFVGRRDMTVGEPITDGLLSLMCDERYKRIRTLITPVFSSVKIKKMCGIVMDCSERLCRKFMEVSEKQQDIDVKITYGCFSMEVIARSAFGVTVDSYADPNSTFITMAKDILHRGWLPWRMSLFIMYPQLMKFFRIPTIPSGVLSFFRDVAMKIVEERKKSGQVQNDFFQLLMEATGECAETNTSDSNAEGSHNSSIKKEASRDKRQTSKKDGSLKALTHDELVGQCLVFFAAGYDSTSSALSFVSFLLALNPECQERAIEEVDAVVNKHKGKINYDTVQEMKYLENVILETLRLYPSIVRLERVASCDYKFERIDITIKKGTVVAIPIYALMRDPYFYEDPERFNPDRFNAEEKGKRDPCTYLPFGAGPRSCIGIRFVMVEMKICLAYVLSQFRFQRCPQTKIPVEFSLGQPFLQPKNMMLRVLKRTDVIHPFIETKT